MENTDNEFFSVVAKIAENLVGIADDILPEYVRFANDVQSGRITDINQIEHTLDTMASLCFDERILRLYKKVIRSIMNQHPETAEAYVSLYYEMYGEGDVGDSI